MALSDEKREQVKALLATGLAKNDVAKKCKISWATVDSISKEEPDKIENIREQKRQEFINKLWENIEDAVELGHQMVKEAKQGARDIPLSNISTYVGTLYDKHALMTGGKTSDVELTIKVSMPKMGDSDADD